MQLSLMCPWGTDIDANRQCAGRTALKLRPFLLTYVEGPGRSWPRRMNIPIISLNILVDLKNDRAHLLDNFLFASVFFRCYDLLYWLIPVWKEVDNQTCSGQEIHSYIHKYYKMFTKMVGGLIFVIFFLCQYTWIHRPIIDKFLK